MLALHAIVLESKYMITRSNVRQAALIAIAENVQGLDDIPGVHMPGVFFVGERQ